MPVLLLGLALFCVLNLVGGNQTSKAPFLQTASQKLEASHKHSANTDVVVSKDAHKKPPNGNTDIARKPSTSGASTNDAQMNFSYKKEVQKVRNLSQNFPESKLELLAIITTKDPFKAVNKTPKPHTTDELLQRKIGAVKVLALRALVINEQNKNTLKKDLISIALNAGDPTITHIAKAMLKSAEDNRSFFDDFNNGLDLEMPL